MKASFSLKDFKNYAVQEKEVTVTTLGRLLQDPRESGMDWTWVN